MGVWILHGIDQQRAVLYDSCYERPFGLGFIGDDAPEQAEIFLAYATRRLGLGLRGARPAIAIEWSEWESLAEDFRDRACCVACGDLAIDDSLRYSEEEIGRALNMLGAFAFGVVMDPAVERLCHDCFVGDGRANHPDALGPLVDDHEEEESEFIQAAPGAGSAPRPSPTTRVLP
jgi:hypothetical protein